MEWGALVGGLIGAGIPAILTYLGLRRARQSTDAEAFGPAVLLLYRLDPIRVSINLRDAETEDARWKDLERQTDEARERLLVVSAGHPRRRVRELAQVAQVALGNAYHNSGWVVSDMLRNRDNPDWMERAQQTHAEAMTAMQDLINANFKWRARRAQADQRPRMRERRRPPRLAE